MRTTRIRVVFKDLQGISIRPKMGQKWREKKQPKPRSIGVRSSFRPDIGSENVRGPAYWSAG